MHYFRIQSFRNSCIIFEIQGFTNQRFSEFKLLGIETFPNSSSFGIRAFVEFNFFQFKIFRIQVFRNSWFYSLSVFFRFYFLFDFYCMICFDCFCFSLIFWNFVFFFIICPFLPVNGILNSLLSSFLSFEIIHLTFDTTPRPCTYTTYHLSFFLHVSTFGCWLTSCPSFTVYPPLPLCFVAVSICWC